MSSLAGKRQHPGRDAWDKALRKLVREVAICEVQKNICFGNHSQKPVSQFSPGARTKKVTYFKS